MKLPRGPWLGLLLAFAAPSLLAAGTIHVDDDAPCDGAGTAASPFCTIQLAVDAAGAGDVVRVAPGTYPPFAVGPSQGGFRIAGAGAAVDCGGGGVGITVSGADVVIEGLTVERCNTGVFLSQARRVTLRRMRIRDNAVDGIRFFEGGSHIVEGNDLEANGTGIRFFPRRPLEQGGQSSDRNRIVKNSIHESTGDGLRIEDKGGELNRIAWNRSERNAGWGFVVGDERNLLERNLAERNGSGGFYVTDADNVLLYNKAKRNGAESGDAEADGFRFSGEEAYELVAVGNEARENARHGFAVLELSTDHILRANRSSHNGGHGFFLTAGVEERNGALLAANRAEHNQGSGFVLADGATGNGLTSNLARHNGGDGFEADATTAGNALTKNRAKANGGVGFRDASSGATGSAGTANDYVANDCRNNAAGGGSPAGLCGPQAP